MSGYAADISSAQSGKWTDASTWVGGVVPTKDDNVTIVAGHSVDYLFNGPSMTLDLCNDLIINGTFLSSNQTSGRIFLLIYGSVICNGSIDYGQTGSKITGAVFIFSGPTGGFTGTGSAKLKDLQVKTTSPIDFLINIPSITLSGIFCAGTKQHITIGASTVLNTGTMSLSNTFGQGTTISSMDIFGVVNASILYLCNGVDTIPANERNVLKIKNGGTLNIQSATVLRSVALTGPVGGSGFDLKIESGGKFNWTTGTNPMDFTIPTNTPYDPKLFVGYYTGSIINGVTKVADETAGPISGVNIPKAEAIGAYYNSVNRSIVLSKEFSNLKIYSVLGQEIYTIGNPDTKVTIPTSCNGMVIVSLLDKYGKFYAFKINLQ